VGKSCQLSDIEQVKLQQWTAAHGTETFGDDKEANAYLTKQYRAPYGLPKV